MTAYVVTAGEYDNYRIVGVFSSEEKARAYLNEPALDALLGQHPKAVTVGGDGHWLHYSKWEYRVEEFDMDSLDPLQWATWAGRAPQPGDPRMDGDQPGKQRTMVGLGSASKEAT